MSYPRIPDQAIATPDELHAFFSELLQSSLLASICAGKSCIPGLDTIYFDQWRRQQRPPLSEAEGELLCTIAITQRANNAHTEGGHWYFFFRQHVIVHTSPHGGAPPVQIFTSWEDAVSSLLAKAVQSLAEVETHARLAGDEIQTIRAFYGQTSRATLQPEQGA
jgi:hypothetical protein